MSATHNPCLLSAPAARHCPPACPTDVVMDVERPNSVVLSWVPGAANSQASTRSIFVVERQQVGSQEWHKCFTSESATTTEVCGSSVQCEGDYNFRVCCINKYGRSGHVAFPKAVHLGEDLCVTSQRSRFLSWYLTVRELCRQEREAFINKETR